MESPSLLSLLRRKGVSPYLVQWVGSFLRDRTCRMTFQGSSCHFAPVSVGVPQGCPISPRLFVIYVSSLHLEIPRSLIISYVDHFAVTMASPSYRTNVRLIQKSFSALKRKSSPVNISCSIPKTELIHWKTTRSNKTPSSLPVQLEDQLFYLQSCLKWLGFIFTPSFDLRSYFSRRYTLANAAMATIRPLSPPGMGLPPYLCLSLALSLLAPILLYVSAVGNTPPSIMGPMSVFWHRVCRWITNCFSSTNIAFLHRDACLPTATCSCTPPTPPCWPKAHLLPPGDKPRHSTPPEICSHLLTLPRLLDGACEDYLPTLSLLQPRLAFLSGQDQEPEVPTQRHHSLAQHGHRPRIRRPYVAVHLPPPDRLPIHNPGDCSILCPPQAKG